MSIEYDMIYEGLSCLDRHGCVYDEDDVLTGWK